jgi:hypothetical protein
MKQLYLLTAFAAGAAAAAAAIVYAARTPTIKWDSDKRRYLRDGEYAERLRLAHAQ